MRSRSRWRLLLNKELHELTASRSYWLLLLATAALVGHAFNNSVALYAEASGAGGGSAALAQGLHPLDGFVVPMFGAYDLVATLLFPFVVIRLFSADRVSGAHTLILQLPVSVAESVAAKTVALLLAWFAAGVAGAIALAVWSGIGGHLYAPEVLTVVAGHFLRGALTIALGAVAAAFATSAASASIVVLAVTIGTWAIDYVAAARGGDAAAIAKFTPAAALRVFERGELRGDTILVLLILTVAGLTICTVWLHDGRVLSRRVRDAAAVALLAALATVGAAKWRASADMSEDRRNSFAAPDEAAIRSLGAPLRITVNLAAEDPRLTDFERGVLGKLRRIAQVDVVYAARGRTGLFGESREHYGEIWYEMNGNRAMSRSVSEPIVLETIYAVAGRPPPPPDTAAVDPGHPLAVETSLGTILLFMVWPAIVTAMWWSARKPRDVA